jgi:predicted kinase
MTDAASILAQKYYESLSNRDLHRQKCVVLFSGVPGSGKSHIAQSIEQELGAIRISNDDIRDLIVAENPGIEPAKRERIKLAVATALLGLLETSPDGLVVFDVSCDRPGGYEFYHDWAAQRGCRIVLLRMDVPRATLEQRIHQRGNTGYRKAAQALANLDVWWKEWEAFGKRQKPDLIVTPNTPIERVFGLINKG